MKVKNSFSLMVLCVVSTLSVSAQISEPPDLEPYFHALLVEDMDVSKGWYMSVLGFETTNETAVEGRFSIVNLKRGKAAVELIELARAVSAHEVIPNYSGKTRINGFFKIGFQVSDLDNWVAFLREKQVQFHGDVVQDQVTGKRMVIILDPDGNRIQLFEK